VQAARHPEWHALNADGTPVNSQILQDGSELYWTWLCPNRGGLVQDFLFPHIAEVLDRYRVHGVFVDMATYLPGSCFCDACTAAMRRGGLDPRDPAEHHRFNSATHQDFAAELRRRLDAKRPDLRLEIGCFNGFGEAHKGRGIVSDFYVESLAFQTGWQYFPMTVRYLRHFGVPIVGYTGRFLKNWGDFGTVVTPHQLKTQLAMHLMAGVASGVGDHMHCSGRLDPAVYRTIGEGFRFVKARQPYCVGMTAAKEIAILAPQGLEANAASADRDNPALDILDAYKGAAKIMPEIHLQYDLVDTDGVLDGFAAVCVTHGRFGPDFVARCRAFAEAGGWLVVGSHGLWPTDPAVRAAWCSLVGVKDFALSPHEGEFYEVTDPRALSEEVPRMPHRVHARAVDARFADAVVPLATTWRSPTARSRDRFYGHFHGPATDEAGMAIGLRRIGKGGAVLIRPQVLAAYLRTGYFVHRAVIRNVLDACLPPERRVLCTNAPSIVELSFGRKNGRHVLQALPFVADRRDRGSFESLCDPVALSGLWVDLLNTRVTRARDPIAGSDVPIEPLAGGTGTRVHLPAFAEHLLVLLE
jgi:hypothetical protein